MVISSRYSKKVSIVWARLISTVRPNVLPGNKALEFPRLLEHLLVTSSVF